MKKYAEEFLKGVVKKAGEVIAGVFLLSLIPAAWLWWKGYRFSPQTIARIEFWSIVVIGVVVVLTVLAFINGLLNRIHELEDQQKQQHFPPPREPLSKAPRSHTDSVGRYVERPSDLAFHVLKAYNRINPNNGALNVQMLSHYCQMSQDDALSAVKELLNLGFISTVIPGPGEWNGHYAITPAGRRCVAQFAT